ncbi:hypothetical protein MNEG_15762, partial [Monoraphidium neglectum]
RRLAGPRAAGNPHLQHIDLKPPAGSARNSSDGARAAPLRGPRNTANAGAVKRAPRRGPDRAPRGPAGPQ